MLRELARTGYRFDKLSVCSSGLTSNDDPETADLGALEAILPFVRELDLTVDQFCQARRCIHSLAWTPLPSPHAILLR